MSLRSRRKAFDKTFERLCATGAVFCVLLLLVLMAKVAIDGAARVSIPFLLSKPSIIFPQKAGVAFAMLGSLWVVGLTILFTVPIGVGAAVYLEEFSPRNSRFKDFIELNLSNLAGVPSIVFGMLGLGIFIGIIGLGKNVLVGALTMSILVLPVVIIVSQEALKAVPRSFREASLAMGTTRWEAVRTVVLPSARAGILTGIILAAARAIGETAPLIVVGAVGVTSLPPQSLDSRYTVMPLQVYNWITNPRVEFRPVAAAAILVLLLSLLILNSVAIFIRARSQGKV